MLPLRATLRLLLLSPVFPAGLSAHDATPVTHSFDRGVATPGPQLILSITDSSTGRLIPARFSVTVDGQTYSPEWIDANGIRFKSIHLSKKEFFTALYGRGTGPVTVSLPAGAREVEVTATRGFEYVPAMASGRVENDRASIQIGLKRWIDLTAQGWIAVDEHLHYDRLDPSADATWLTMMEADGLTAGHFMTLKGGMVPGVWARQFAYGHEGQATDGSRLLVPGEEYRDPAMGHINLLGVERIIEPISTGGYGVPVTHENFPPLHDVLLEARAAGALTGVAHGSTLGRHPTAVADAVLGTVDFWELSNGFIYSTETWYRLLNCGYFLPPAAGTDLPNSPYRDPWQPMLGSVRTYVHTGGRSDFESFKAAMAGGRVFITGGPIIDITVNGKHPGETVELPPEGGRVVIKAGLSSVRPLHELHLVHNGREVPAIVTKSTEGPVQRPGRSLSGGPASARAADGAAAYAEASARPESAASSELAERRREAVPPGNPGNATAPVQRQTIECQLVVKESGWFAAWGKGEPVRALDIDAMAHTGAVRVLVGDKPVRSKDDLAYFIELLTRQREYYLKEGRYRSEADRLHAAKIFERALDQLRARLEQ